MDGSTVGIGCTSVWETNWFEEKVGGSVELEAVDHMKLYAWTSYCCSVDSRHKVGGKVQSEKCYSLGAETEWSLSCILLGQGAGKKSEDQKSKMCRGDWAVHVVDRRVASCLVINVPGSGRVKL